MPDTGTDALHAVKRLLAERPDKVGPDFSEATRLLAGWRDELIACWRQTRSEADRRNLERANAILSVIVGGHFPIGPVPWPQIQRAHDDLVDLVSATG